MTQPQIPRNRLLPWYPGIAIVVVAVALVAYDMVVTNCQAPTIIQARVLLVIPAVYLVLMYLTFVSQD